MGIRKYRAWHNQEKKMYPVAGIEWQHWSAGDVWSEWPRVNVNRGVCTDGYGYYLCWYDMNELVLTESTGLFDKDGKEVFEGDFVRFENIGYDPSEGETPWEYDIVSFRENMWKIGNHWIGDFSTSSIEIIGNIHENFDLKKV